MKTLYSLEEFVVQANERLATLGLVPTVTVRQVRDYASKNKMSSPHKEGREARYDDSHVEEVLALRHAKSIGISSRGLEAVKQFMISTPEDNLYFTSSSAINTSDALFSRGLIQDSPPAPVLFGAEGVTAVSEAAQSFLSVSAGGANADANTNRDAKSRALSFLSNLDKTSPPKKALNAQANSLISGAAGLVSSTYGAALRGKTINNVANSSDTTPPTSRSTETREEIKPYLTNAAMTAEIWNTWEFIPGVRLQLRSDVLEKWDENTQSDLIEAIKQIPKNSK
jgi:hypothetical protein